MAPLNLHGLPSSTCTMRVLTVLYEKALQFELIPVDLAAGHHKSPAFLALNPFGQVPVFEEGDLKIFESRAITQYISHQYSKDGTQLVSRDPPTMAKIAVAIEVESHQFNPPADALIFEICLKPMMGLKADPSVIQENEAKLAKVLDVYEARLAETKYLVGDYLTLADLHHLPSLYYLSGTRMKKLLDSRPHVSAWCTDLMARPAWAKVLALQKKGA